MVPSLKIDVFFSLANSPGIYGVNRNPESHKPFLVRQWTVGLNLLTLYLPTLSLSVPGLSISVGH